MINPSPVIPNSKNNSRWQGLALFTLIFVVFVSYWYGSFLGSLNQTFFNGAGDGLKSYYNVAYHINYGSPLLHHAGMSYPYGEYLILEDSMPILSISLKLLSRVFPFVGDYTVGIVNALFFLSLFAGAFLLFHLLLRFKVDSIPSAIGANAILFLSSQNLLLFPAGHMALTFSAFFILGWVLLLKYFESKNKIKWSMAIAFNIIFWAFMHAYLGLILLMFTLASHLIYTLVVRFSSSRVPDRYLWPLVQVAVPILVFILFYRLLDHHPDRIDMPFIETHRSTLTSILVPSVSPIREHLSNFLHLADPSVFAWTTVGTYIGVVSILTMLCFALECSVSIFKRGIKAYLNQFPILLIVSFLSSVMLLLFSFALPFRWFPDALLNDLPYIKQFSSYGRFAWAFYYVLTTCSLVFWSVRLREFLWRKWALTLAAFLFLVEAIPVHSSLSDGICKTENSFQAAHLPAENRVLNIENPERYQAILPLPTFFVYGLPFSTRAFQSSMYGALSASALTGLPVLSTFLSRPSVSESLNIFKLIGPAPYQIRMDSIVNDGRNIAVVILLSDTVNLNSKEKILLSKCKPIALSDSYAIYSLSVEGLINYKEPEISANLLSSTTDSIWSNPPEVFYYYDNLDTFTSREEDLGKGAYEGVKNRWNQVFKISTAQMDTGRVYNLSYWYYNHVWDQTFNTAIVHETDSAGETMQWLYYSPLEARVVDGWWYYSEFQFSLKSKNTALALLFNGEEKFEPWFAVDEVLLRPADVDIIRKDVKDSTMHFYKNGLLLGVFDNAMD